MVLLTFLIICYMMYSINFNFTNDECEPLRICSLVHRYLMIFRFMFERLSRSVAFPRGLLLSFVYLIM